MRLSTLLSSSLLSLAAATAVQAATVTNLSTRGLVGAGNDVMILGVVVEGEPGTHIPVVFRGIGPLLAEFGVTNAVENPAITLFSGSAAIASNDDWMLGGQTNALAATGLQPTYESEAAMVANLAPGVYTLHMSGASGMGNALGEAYFIEKKSIVDNLVAAGRFGTLVAAVQAAGLVDVLNSAGPFTLFAPTDEAFAALPAGTVQALLADVPALTNILLYHVVPGAQVLASQIAPGPIMTANGEPVSLSLEGGVFVNTSQVIEADWLASNGVIHPVSSVILPGPASTSQTIVQNLVAQGDFTTLVAAVTAAGLVDTLNSAGPFTLFAPTDAAFAKLPEGTVAALLADIPTLTDILLYHVVSGAKVLSANVVPGGVAMANGDSATLSAEGGLKINQANISGVDWESSNGVIHFIDSVILPPAP